MARKCRKKLGMSVEVNHRIIDVSSGEILRETQADIPTHYKEAF